MDAKLLIKADRHGFSTHDGREEEQAEHFFHCDECSLGWLTELNSWFSDRYHLYVQVECFNAYAWGYRIYDLSGTDESKGAPVLEEQEPEFPSQEEALIAGLTQAFEQLQLI